MVWARFEDQFHNNPKIQGLSDAAFRLYVCAITYSNSARTDGVLTLRQVGQALPGVTDRSLRRLADELVGEALWHTDVVDRWLIHDYHEYQPSASEVTKRQGLARLEAQLKRSPEIREAVKDRDGDLCAFCGKVVVFADRKTGSGGRFFHLDASETNQVGNVVVACRRCITLLPTPDQIHQVQNRLASIDPDQVRIRSVADPVPVPVPERASLSQEAERVILSFADQTGITADNQWIAKRIAHGQRVVDVAPSDCTIDDLVNDFVPWAVHERKCYSTEGLESFLNGWSSKRPELHLPDCPACSGRGIGEPPPGVNEAPVCPECQGTRVLTSSNVLEWTKPEMRGLTDVEAFEAVSR